MQVLADTYPPNRSTTLVQITDLMRQVMIPENHYVKVSSTVVQPIHVSARISF